jgi:hypothetical protein
MDGATLIGWKLYYCTVQGVRSTYSSKDGPWELAPFQDVQYLFRYWEKDGKKWKEKLGGCDIYALNNDQCRSIFEGDPKLVKLGTEIDSDMLLEVMREAMEDPEAF